jgi:hypothetical protein
MPPYDLTEREGTRMLRPFAAALIAVACFTAAAASAAAPEAPGTVTVIAKGLNNPRQVTVAPSGAIYVAEAGKAGPTCPTKDVCLGFSSAVTRVVGGKATRVLGLLPSLGGRDGSFTTGADGVSVADDGTLFVAMTGAPCGTKVPAPAARFVGKILRKAGTAGPRPVADITALECRSNPDHTDRNPNPYAVLALSPTRTIAVDAGGNTLYDVNGSRAKLLAVLPKLPNGAQSVPTSIAIGRDGAYYVGEFGGEAKKPVKNAARVFRVDPASGKVRVAARGFNAITGLAFDTDGNMYVTEASLDPRNQNEFRGDVVKVAADGGARTRLGIGKLFFPAGAAIGKDGHLYVSNYSVLPASTPKKSPFRGAGGQLVRVALS